MVTRLPRARAEAELLRMLAAIRHEPFYTIGMWADEPAGVYVGWSAREHAADMLLRNACGDLVVVLSGELVPEPRTEQLVASAESDSAFPAGLNGRFHGIKVSRRRGTATLFNDRYGMHRLYYYVSKDTFYFAAEAKAILSARPELGTVDPKGLGEFISCGCVLENRTLFEGIHVLPCASSWVLRNGAVETAKQYFDAKEWEGQPLLEPNLYYEELRDTFSRTLPRYFEAGGERIGMSLTGGLDTRVVMAWHRCGAGSLPCYTFGGTFRDCADVRVARQVARICRQPHEVITVGDDFLARFSTYAERTVYLSDGCADVSRSADLYVNEKARDIAPVRMTGNYGGEVLRRVRAFKPVEPRTRVFNDDLMRHIRQARETYATVAGGHPLSFAMFRQAPWHHYGLLALEQTQISVRSPFLDNDFVRTVFRAPAATLRNNDVCLRLIRDGNPALRAIATDRGPVTGPSASLRASRLWDAARRSGSRISYKAEYAYDYGMPQWIAPIDRLLACLRPERLFLGRHKFYHFRVWYRDALSRYVRDMLLDPQALSRPYVERREVEKIVNSHLQGRRNYTVEIHKLITLELVHRLLVDGHSLSRLCPPKPRAGHAA